MPSAADVVVIGAGQSGLAAARALQAHGIRPVVLEAEPEPVGSWPHYYDSLTLFSPADYSSLPGLEFGRGGEGVADPRAQQPDLGIVSGMVAEVEPGGPVVVAGAQQTLARADAVAGAQRLHAGGVQPLRGLLPAPMPRGLIPVGDLPCGDDHFTEVRAAIGRVAGDPQRLEREGLIIEEKLHQTLPRQAVMPSCTAMTWTSEFSQYSAKTQPSMRRMSVPVKSNRLPGAAVAPGIPRAYSP